MTRLLLVAVLLITTAAACGRSRPSKFSLSKWSQTHHITTPDGIEEATYLSEAMPLRAGQIRNTDPMTTQLKFPPGRIAITGFRAEIVDANNNSVPLDSVYLHHWSEGHPQG